MMGRAYQPVKKPAAIIPSLILGSQLNMELIIERNPVKPTVKIVLPRSFRFVN